MATSLQPAVRSESRRQRWSAHWKKWRDLLIKFLRSAWTQTIAGAILGLLMAWAVDNIHFYLQKRPFHAVWDNVLNNQHGMPIVIGAIKFKEFQPQHTKHASHLPDNVLLVGVQDAAGVTLLQEEFVSVFGKGSVSLFEPQEFDSYKTKSSFISVGGWSVNEVTFDLLVQRRMDTKFTMVYPDHYALDSADGKSYHADEQNGLITKDYGFILIGPNPYDAQKTVCLAFGIWPQGTKSALEALTRPDSNSLLGREFISKVRGHKGVLAIIETKVTGLQQGRPTFVKVRDLVGP